ncbi:MAG: hypothetical protein F6K17_14305 [Okeania sp. SIO3C4]|nr:hypothetical protein [Okeania sp. SIO3C4]
MMVVIAAATLSSAVTSEEPVDLSWFRKISSPLAELVNKPVVSAGNFASKVIDGGKALAESIQKGTFGKIFNQWAKDDPLAAAAGTVAAGLAGGTLLIAGGSTLGWLTGSVGSVVSSLGAGGALVAGGTLGGLATGILTTAENLYEFDLQISDKRILADIKSAVDNLYGPAGEFIGRQIATMAVGGLNSPPKVQINLRAMALVWQLNPELRQELLQNVSNFAYQGIQTGIQIAIKFAFLHGRRAIKKLWKRFPNEVKKLVPGLDKAISKWGDDDNEPWSLEDGVNKLEKTIIKDERILNFSQGLRSGLWRGFSDSIEIIT